MPTLRSSHVQVINYLFERGLDASALPAHLQKSVLLPSAERKRTAKEKGHQVKLHGAFYKLQELLQRHDLAYIEGMSAEEKAAFEADAEDHSSWTSLMHAAFTDDAEVAEKLFALGARPELRNKYNFSALLFAHWMGAAAFRKVVRKVKGPQADVLDANDQKCAPLCSVHSFTHGAQHTSTHSTRSLY